MTNAVVETGADGEGLADEGREDDSGGEVLHCRLEDGGGRGCCGRNGCDLGRCSSSLREEGFYTQTGRRVDEESHSTTSNRSQPAEMLSLAHVVRIAANVWRFVRRWSSAPAR